MTRKHYTKELVPPAFVVAYSYTIAFEEIIQDPNITALKFSTERGAQAPFGCV
jgi:Na+-transporting methylmalonyl-CoA/oxaloacetate decarboxylase beta subunit